jgi:hypothetical protein
LSEMIFLSFRKNISWPNSYNFQNSFWRPRSETGWRDWFEWPHTKVMIIHKINPGLFIFIWSRSGIEMLNPRGIPYMRSELLKIVSLIGLVLSQNEKKEAK